MAAATLFLSGPAGLGKTRLIRATARKAEAAGLRVEGGAVAPQDREVPLASIREMANCMRDDRPSVRSVGICRRWTDRMAATRSDRGACWSAARPTRRHPRSTSSWRARSSAESQRPAPGVAGPAIDHADGLLRLAAGSLSAARDALESTARGWDERGRIWETTWARLALVSSLIRSNRFAESAAVLAGVRETATTLEGPLLLAGIEELSRIANRHGSFDEPWRPLTSREFEVARCIAAGMTNGEIAGELAIAPKTASAHVEHIVAKLGASRRAEIATWVANIALRTTAPAKADPAAFSHR